MPKSAEFRQKMLEGWAAAQAKRDERRRQNRERWAAKRRDWSDDQEHRVETAVVPEIPAEMAGSGSLAKMRAIMANPKTPLHRRLDAAECVLAFEVGPGAAAGLEPDQIAAGAYHFLKAVSDAPETPETLRFKAIRAMANVENARATARRAAESAEQFREKRELFRQVVNAERRRCLIDAGAWPPSDDAWLLKPSDDFDLPAGLSDMEWPPQNIGGILDQAQPDTAFRATLLSVRAKNRTDDAWDPYGLSTPPTA